MAEAMLAALGTGLEKIPGSRLVALGTRPADSLHWFEKMLQPGGADYVQVHAARKATEHRKADPPFQARTWHRANPSLSLHAFAVEGDPAGFIRVVALEFGNGRHGSKRARERGHLLGAD